MKSFAALLRILMNRSLINFLLDDNYYFNNNNNAMLTQLPSSVLCLIDTYNGCAAKYNLLLVCKYTYISLRNEPNSEYRSHFIPKLMLKRSFVPLRSTDHALLPSSLVDPVLDSTMGSGYFSLANACFCCLHYLPMSAVTLPTVYTCVEVPHPMLPMPLDHKCFHNLNETYTMVQDSMKYIAPEDAPYVVEIYRFGTRDTFSKSVVTVCDHGCVQYMHDVVTVGMQNTTVKREPTAIIATKIDRIIRHSKEFAVIKLQVTVYLTPEVEFHAQFLSTAEILDFYCVKLSDDPIHNSTTPFVHTYYSYIVVDPKNETMEKVSKLYNEAIFDQRKRNFARVNEYSPFKCIGKLSLPGSIRLPRDDMLAIIEVYDDIEGMFPLDYYVENEAGNVTPVLYHYGTIIRCDSFGGNGMEGKWVLDATVCNHNLLEEDHPEVARNLRDNFMHHYGFSQADVAYVQVEGSFYIQKFEIPHLLCFENLSFLSSSEDDDSSEYSYSELTSA